jgi:bacterioferritin-associated ferredoxin
MIVCVCRGVNEREVRDTIHAGCATEESIGQRCGAGTDCGSCLETLRELLQDRRAHHAPAPAGSGLARPLQLM